jgi:hypothetical protein
MTEEFTEEEWDDIIEHSFGDHGIPYLHKFRHMGWRNGKPPERYPNEELVTSMHPKLVAAWLKSKKEGISLSDALASNENRP